MARKTGLFMIVLFIAVFALLGGTVMADTVQYTTSGAFTCGAATVGCSTGTNSVTVNAGNGNTMTVTFAGTNTAPFGVDAPSNISFGDLITSATGHGAGTTDGSSSSDSGACATGPCADDIIFNLTINQTVPTVGQGTLTGELDGFIRINSSTGLIDFFLTSDSVGIQDSLYSTVPDIQLLAPSTVHSGDTSLQGTVSTVPEPASLALLGTGLLAGGNFVRRKLIGK